MFFWGGKLPNATNTFYINLFSPWPVSLLSNLSVSLRIEPYTISEKCPFQQAQEFQHLWTHFHEQVQLGSCTQENTFRSIHTDIKHIRRNINYHVIHKHHQVITNYIMCLQRTITLSFFLEPRPESTHHET